LVTRKLPAAVEARLQRDYDARLNPTDRLYSKDELVEQARGAQAILPCHTEHFSSDVLERLPAEVRIIANFSVGYDHVDVEAAKRKSIVVTNTPDVLSDATAELTMMLMIGAARRAGEGERLVREGRWKDWSPAFMVGTQVTGKRLGILGMGRVGQVVAKRARGFDMAIHYHDVRRLPAEVEAGAVFHDTLEDLLPHCDFLTLHCNVTPATPTTTNPASMRASWHSATPSSCPTSAAPRRRRETPWASARSTTSTPSSPAASPATASRKRKDERGRPRR
jgi:lactate dehydrogenase-like 2-hydroxyacid dehydrogenase